MRRLAWATHPSTLPVLMVAVAVGLLTVVSSLDPWASGPASSGAPTIVPTVAPSSPPSSVPCTAYDGLPDSTCTPGKVAVTDAAVLCAPGYRTRGVRPPASYTSSLKRRQLQQYGWYAGRAISAYEEDHLVPLELGGDPRDPTNLWPEANYKDKDVVESAAKRAVCAHQLVLADAQRSIAANWRALGVRLGVLRS